MHEGRSGLSDVDAAGIEYVTMWALATFNIRFVAPSSWILFSAPTTYTTIKEHTRAVSTSPKPLHDFDSTRRTKQKREERRPFFKL